MSLSQKIKNNSSKKLTYPSILYIFKKIIFVNKIIPTKNLFINLKMFWLPNVKANARFKIEYIRSVTEKFFRIKNFWVFSNIKTGGSR